MHPTTFGQTNSINLNLREDVERNQERVSACICVSKGFWILLRSTQSVQFRLISIDVVERIELCCFIRVKHQWLAHFIALVCPDRAFLPFIVVEGLTFLRTNQEYCGKMQNCIPKSEVNDAEVVVLAAKCTKKKDQSF